MARVKHLKVILSVVLLIFLSGASKAEDEATVETDSGVDTAENEVSKAYEGKGAKVLPILAKLQKRYESMEDGDKSKLLEKADTYRAKFKTAIDKIDEETAAKYGLNINLIHKILGLDSVSEKEMDEEAEVADETEETEVTEDTEEIEETEENEENEATEATETVREAKSFPPPVILSKTYQPVREHLPNENYDHLLIRHNEEDHQPSVFNVDDLVDEPVLIPGEDQHYQQFRDSMHLLSASLLQDVPKPIFPGIQDDMSEDEYKRHLAAIPFPEYDQPAHRVDTMDPYDAEYVYNPLEAAHAIHRLRPQAHHQPPSPAYYHVPGVHLYRPAVQLYRPQVYYPATIPVGRRYLPQGPYVPVQVVHPAAQWLHL